MCGAGGEVALTEEPTGRPMPNEPPEPSPVTKLRPQRQERIPPHNAVAEEQLLGALLTFREAPERVVGTVDSDAFYVPRNAHVFRSIEELVGDKQPVDIVTVMEHLRRSQLLETVGGPQRLLDLQGDAGPNYAAYAGIVAETAALRRTLASLSEAVEAAYANDFSSITKALDAAGGVMSAATVADDGEDIDIDRFLDEPEPDYRWLVPGLLERQDRLILTGPEGGGKSTLLRQIAVQLAAGVHPFLGTDVEPLRVLYVDCENTKSQVRRQMRTLRLQAHIPLPHLKIRVRSDGLDLTGSDDQRWLEDRVRANRPDVLIVGPLYKLGDGDPTEEKVGKPIAMAFDRLRVTYDCAILIEAHSPHAQGSTRRPERPYGWSGWMRWPEFGLFVAPDGALRHWRGARDEREWPSMLKRGGEWPWTVETDPKAVNFARLLAEVNEHGPGSLNELSKRTQIPRSTVDRLIKANQKQYDEACARWE